MKRLSLSIKPFIWIGIFFVLIIGSLLHFVYDWSGQNTLVSFIAPISESVWEHFKLGFYALMLYAILAYPFIKDKVHNYIFGLGISSLILTAIIGIGYSLYTEISYHSIFWFDIALFVLGIFVAFWALYKIITYKQLPPLFNWIGLLIILITIGLFIVFTINPPTQFELFKDPTKQAH